MSDLDDERLSALLDDELDDLERARLERALTADPALRAQLAHLREVRDRVRRHGPVRAPAGFAHRVMDAVEADPATAGRGAWWRRPFGLPLEGLAVAAIATLVLVAVLPEPEPPPPEPASLPAVTFEGGKGGNDGGIAPTYMATPAYALSLTSGTPDAVLAAIRDLGGIALAPDGTPVSEPLTATTLTVRLEASQVALLRRALEGLGTLEPVGVPREIRGVTELSLELSAP